MIQKKLKKLRIKNNLTIQQISNELGICKSYYSLIENGKRRLYYDLAINIAHIFNMKPDDIFYTKKLLYKKEANH